MSSTKSSKLAHLREVENVRGRTNIIFCAWEIYFSTWPTHIKETRCFQEIFFPTVASELQDVETDMTRICFSKDFRMGRPDERRPQLRRASKSMEVLGSASINTPELPSASEPMEANLGLPRCAPKRATHNPHNLGRNLTEGRSRYYNRQNCHTRLRRG